MKQYSKPQIMFEDFSLSVNIAAGCENQANSSPLACPYTDDFFDAVFSADPGSQCKIGPSPEMCYQNPSDAFSVYSS